MRPGVGAAAAAAVALGAAGLAWGQALMANGSFEAGPFPGAFRRVDAGEGGLPGWTVLSGNIEVIGTHFPCADGGRCVDMNGDGAAGVIGQAVRTRVGARYEVIFFMAGNPDCGSRDKRMTVQVDDQARTFGHDRGLQWTLNRWSFTARQPLTLLVFESLEAGSCGPLLDDVMVTAAGG